MISKEDRVFKRVFYIILAVIFVVSTADAKKKKTAEIKDKTATDLKYGWTLPVPDNWKAKNRREPDVERLFLEKKNYLVNPFVQRYGGDYTVPRVIIFAQEFNGTYDDFEALIVKSLEEHKSDNEIISKLDLLRDAEYIASGDIMLDSLPVRQIYVKRNYSRVLAIPQSGGGGMLEDVVEEYINDHEVHEIYLIKLENLLMVFQAYSEREFYETNAVEFRELLKSIRF
jgi:hypothetical protein